MRMNISIEKLMVALFIILKQQPLRAPLERTMKEDSETETWRRLFSILQKAPQLAALL